MNLEELLKRNQEQLQKQQGDYLYFIQSSKTGMIKIGRSKHPKKSLK